MSEKEQALNQLNQIHSTLVDKEKFLPYNYNILILWGVISAILFLTYEDVAKINLLLSTGYILGFILIGSVIEFYFMKLENKKYDLSSLTKTQIFIESIYGLNTLFGILITNLFISHSLNEYSYIVWIFILGVNKYMVGFATNLKKFTQVGIINIIIAFILFLATLYGIDTHQLGKYLAVLFVSGGCIYLGITLTKEQKSV